MNNDQFVARTYLKHWADPGPMRAYRKSDLKSFPCWPADVCAEMGGDLNPEYLKNPALLGQFRSIFEPHWNEAVEAVRERHMTSEHKYIIAGYWANLVSATPTLRNIGVNLFEKGIQSVLPMFIKDHPPPESLKNAKLTVEVDPNYIKAVATTQLLAGTWQLYNQPWTILVNGTEDEFITSDNPSALYPPPAIGAGPTVRILPISPRLCISTVMDQTKAPTRELTREDLTSRPQGPITYHDIVPDGVTLANRLIAANADNLVFSRTENPKVAALVEEFRDHGVQLHHSVKETPANGGHITQSAIFVGKKPKSSSAA